MTTDKPETVTFTKVVPIADADGKAIRVGSVLKEINDGERGVVCRIMRVGDRGTIFDQAGDLHVHTGIGSTRCTNRYNQWRHIPKDEQTYRERYVSWLKTPHDEKLSILIHGEEMPQAARVAIDGIMALLPSDTVDWENGPWPDSIDQTLNFLAEHLSTIAKQERP